MQSRNTQPVVLLVDDSPDVLTLCARGLEAKGFSVLKAHGAFEAIELGIHSRRLDILATDISLPELYRARTPMHGVELMGRLVELYPELKVVFFSGMTDAMIKKFGGLPAGTAFLRKPFTADELIRMIEGLRGRRGALAP